MYQILFLGISVRIFPSVSCRPARMNVLQDLFATLPRREQSDEGLMGLLVC